MQQCVFIFTVQLSTSTDYLEAKLILRNRGAPKDYIDNVRDLQWE